MSDRTTHTGPRFLDSPTTLPVSPEETELKPVESKWVRPPLGYL